MDESGPPPPPQRRRLGILSLPEPTDTPAMNRAFALVFTGVAIVATAALLPPQPAGLVPALIAAVVVVALLTAGAVWRVRDLALSGPALHALNALGTVLVTLVVLGGGAWAPAYAIFYVWVTVYAAAFFSLRGWLAHLALAGGGYLLAVLGTQDLSDGLVRFLPTVAGPALVIGAFVHAVSARLRRYAGQLAECVTISGELVSETVEREALLERICRALRQAARAASVQLLTAEPEGETLRVAGAGTSNGSASVPDWHPSMVGHAPALLPRERGGAQRAGTRLWQPLTDRGQRIGALVVDWDRPVARLSDQLATLVTAYAEQAAAALRYSEVVTRLQAAAATDPLTGVRNRRGLDETLSEELERARRTSGPLTLALLDLDDFKSYNDAHGHVAGDRALRTAVDYWVRTLRPTDRIARIGGDEFAVVLPATDTEDARAVIDRLCALPPEVGLTCSAGLAAWQRDDSDTSLFGRADDALYVAKTARG